MRRATTKRTQDDRWSRISRRPRWLNDAMIALVRLGINPSPGYLGDVRVLTTRGRKSGQPHTTPVSLVVVEGARYVVAGSVKHDWVKNLRAHPVAQLRFGRHVEDVRMVEVAAAHGGTILGAYLQQVRGARQSFAVPAEATPAALAAAAVNYPVFRVDRVEP